MDLVLQASILQQVLDRQFFFVLMSWPMRRGERTHPMWPVVAIHAESLTGAYRQYSPNKSHYGTDFNIVNMPTTCPEAPSWSVNHRKMCDEFVAFMVISLVECSLHLCGDAACLLGCETSAKLKTVANPNYHL
eukprot:1507216-Amphidinium_carterae.1